MYMTVICFECEIFDVFGKFFSAINDKLKNISRLSDRINKKKEKNLKQLNEIKWNLKNWSQTKQNKCGFYRLTFIWFNCKNIRAHLLLTDR